MLRFMFITGDPNVACHAAECGVDRIFVDMEVLGKAERQGHLDTHRAAHSLADLSRVRSALANVELMVRINPLHEGTKQEVDSVIECGADRLMLPMFRTRENVRNFLSIVADRVSVTLLAETSQALVRVPSYVDLLGDNDEVYFGLNDLSLDLSLDFLFEPLAGRLLDGCADYLNQHKIPFGFGGIGRIGSPDPVPAELVLSEHVRLGSSWVILSRAFHSGANSLTELCSRVDLADSIGSLREKEGALRGAAPERLIENARRLARCVFKSTAEG